MNKSKLQPDASHVRRDFITDGKARAELLVLVCGQALKARDSRADVGAQHFIVPRIAGRAWPAQVPCAPWRCATTWATAAAC